MVPTGRSKNSRNWDTDAAAIGDGTLLYLSGKGPVPIRSPTSPTRRGKRAHFVAALQTGSLGVAREIGGSAPKVRWSNGALGGGQPREPGPGSETLAPVTFYGAHLPSGLRRTLGLACHQWFALSNTPRRRRTESPCCPA